MITAYHNNFKNYSVMSCTKVQLWGVSRHTLGLHRPSVFFFFSDWRCRKVLNTIMGY